MFSGGHGGQPSARRSLQLPRPRGRGGGPESAGGFKGVGAFVHVAECGCGVAELQLDSRYGCRQLAGRLVRPQMYPHSQDFIEIRPQTPAGARLPFGGSTSDCVDDGRRCAYKQQHAQRRKRQPLRWVTRGTPFQHVFQVCAVCACAPEPFPVAASG